MRFLFITATPLNSIEGSGTYVGIETLRVALRNLGHTVKILAPDFWCPNFVLRRYLFNFFLPFHPSLSPHQGERTKVRGVSLQNEGRPFDVVVGFDCDGYCLKISSSKYVVSIKGVLADEAKQEKGLIRWLLQLQARWELKNVQKAGLVIATSQYCKRVIQENYGIEPGKIRIIPELIDVEAWRRLLANASTHPQKKGGTVLTVCRMYPRKNLGVLLRAWRQVKEEEPTATLRIVGSGQEYRRWVELSRRLQLGESVIFLGDRTQEELAQEYKNCAIFCLPSRQEGFGIVFLEAMTAAKPIVAARAGAVPEVVQEGKSGFLISPDDSEELTKALLHLIREPELRLEMGKHAQYSVQRYESVKIVSQFLSLF